MRTSRWFTIIAMVALLMAILPGPVAAQTGKNTLLGQDYILATGDSLDNDLIVLGGHVRLELGSVVNGNVTVLGGETTVGGTINGDLVAMGGIVDLQTTAVIDGDLVVLGSVRRSSGAVVRGHTIEGLDAASRLRPLRLPAAESAATAQPVPTIQPVPTVRPALPAQGTRTPLPWPLGWMRDLFGAGMRMLAVLVLATLAHTLMPRALGRTVDVMRTNWALSFGMGVLTLAAAGLLVLVLVILVLVLVGVPLLLVLALALALAITLGWAGAGAVVGEWLAPRLRLHEPTPLVRLLAGTAAITLLAMVPCAGPIFAALTVCWGLGAAVMANVSALRQWPRPGGPVPNAGAPAPEHGAPPTKKGDTRRLTGPGAPFGFDRDDNPPPERPA